MNTQNKTLEQQLKDLKDRRDPDKLLKFITRQPAKKWTPPDFKGPILSYTLASELDPLLAHQANRFWVQTSPLTFSNGYSTKIEIKHCEEIKRLDSLNKGIFGHDFCYILDPKQGTLLLDKANMLYLHLDEEQKLDFQFKRIRAEIDKKE